MSSIEEFNYGFPVHDDKASSLYFEKYQAVQKYTIKEWEKRLLPHHEFPPRSYHIKWLIRHGIPNSIRPSCWFMYSGAKELYEKHSGYYTLLTFRELQDRKTYHTQKTHDILDFIQIIEGDVHRTFPQHPHFHPSQLHSKLDLGPSLRRILVAFAYYSWPHPEESRSLPRKCTYKIGYCQGLNFIVGILLIVFANGREKISEKSDTEFLEKIEEQVFWMLVITVEKLMPLEVYGKHLNGAHLQQDILWHWIIKQHGPSFGLDEFSGWIHRMDPQSEYLESLQSVTTSWFMNLFINVLPIHSMLRVLDSFFYQGEKILFRIAISLLQLNQHNIIGFDEIGDACKYIKLLPKRILDVHSLFQFTFIPKSIQEYSSTQLKLQIPWVKMDKMEPKHEEDDQLTCLGASHLTKSILNVARDVCILDHY